MSSEENQQPPVEIPGNEFDYSQEKLIAMAAQGFVPALFDRLSFLDTGPGDIIVFRYIRKVPYQAQKNLNDNIDAWLRKRGLTAMFLGPDMEVAGSIAHPGNKLAKMMTAQETPKPDEVVSDSTRG